MSRLLLYNPSLASRYYNINQRIMLSIAKEHSKEHYKDITNKNHINNWSHLKSLRKGDIFALKPSNINGNVDENIKKLSDILKKNEIECTLDKELLKDYKKFWNIYHILRENGINPYLTFQMYLCKEQGYLNDFVSTWSSPKVKLVRGAYLKQEDPKHLHLSKQDTDKSYKDAINLLESRKVPTIYATYNRQDLQYINTFKTNQQFGFLHLIPPLNFTPKKHSIIYNYMLCGNLSDTLPYIRRQLPSFLYYRFRSLFGRHDSC
jgi:hypothetical protein